MAQQATLSLTLAGGSEVPGDRGLAIDLSRVDIETALDSGDEVVELLLDLEAREVDGGATRRHTLAVGCTLADLERMLEDAGDSVRVQLRRGGVGAGDPRHRHRGSRTAREDGRAGGRGRHHRCRRGRRSGDAQPGRAQRPAAPAARRSLGARHAGRLASASAASTEGAPATRANPSEAAAAGIDETRDWQSRRGSTPTETVLPSGQPSSATGGDRPVPRPAVRFGPGIPGERRSPASRAGTEAELGRLDDVRRRRRHRAGTPRRGLRGCSGHPQHPQADLSSPHEPGGDRAPRPPPGTRSPQPRRACPLVRVHLVRATRVARVRARRARVRRLCFVGAPPCMRACAREGAVVPGASAPRPPLQEPRRKMGSVCFV